MFGISASFTWREGKGEQGGKERGGKRRGRRKKEITIFRERESRKKRMRERYCKRKSDRERPLWLLVMIAITF